MICWRVCDVVECFARNSDDGLRNCKVMHALDREWALLLRPAEHNLPNLTPFWANRNFGADSSGVLAVSILKRKVNVAVCFHFCINDAPRKRIPFFPRAGSPYLHTPVSFEPPTGWPQLVIHMFCVGLPITLVVRRYANGKS